MNQYPLNELFFKCKSQKYPWFSDFQLFKSMGQLSDMKDYILVVPKLGCILVSPRDLVYGTNSQGSPPEMLTQVQPFDFALTRL